VDFVSAPRRTATAPAGDLTGGDATESASEPP
jgi:hypothetical protein